MKQKLLATTFGIALFSLSLSGCGKKEEPAPEPAPPPARVATPEAPAVMRFEEGVLFEFDKAELKPEGTKQLDAYREQAKAELSTAEHVRIVGYTDNTGSAEHNETLSLKRAEAVRDYLASIGVDSSKMEAVGAGDANPIADNGTKEGQAMNRRVEIEVTGVKK